MKKTCKDIQHKPKLWFISIQLLIFAGDESEVDAKVDVYATPRKLNGKSLPWE